MADPNVKIKKVNAYPFPVQIKTGTGVLNGSLVKLTPQGYLAEIPPSAYQPGDRFEFSFEVPVLHKMAVGIGVVVKVYNQWAGGSGAVSASNSATSNSATSNSAPASANPSPPPAAGASAAASTSKMAQLIEVHFQMIKDEHRAVITSFLQAVAKAGK